VVKPIGDDVLYTPDELSAWTIALNPAKILTDHRVVPPVRAGVTGGAVMMRDGDVFGPVVTTALSGCPRLLQPRQAL